MSKVTQLQNDLNSGLSDSRAQALYHEAKVVAPCVCVCVTHVVCVCTGARGFTAFYFSSFPPSLSRNCFFSHLPLSLLCFYPWLLFQVGKDHTTITLNCALAIGRADSGLDFGLAHGSSWEQGGE